MKSIKNTIQKKKLKRAIFIVIYLNILLGYYNRCTMLLLVEVELILMIILGHLISNNAWDFIGRIKSRVMCKVADR